MSMNQPTSIRALIVEEQSLVRDGIKLLLNGEPDLSIIAVSGSRVEAIEIAASEQPNIIILDPSLDEGRGYSIIPELLAVTKSAGIIILTGIRDSQTHSKFVQLGAKGLVLKHRSSGLLIDAIKSVHAGEVWLERSIIASLIHELLFARKKEKSSAHVDRATHLTKREREIIALVANGLKNKEISKSLLITEATVSHHLTSIFNKLGVSDRSQLIVYVYRHGLA